MEQLDDDCDRMSIPLVKISDNNKALQFGLEETPSVLYFKHHIPGESFQISYETFLMQTIKS